MRIHTYAKWKSNSFVICVHWKWYMLVCMCCWWKLHTERTHNMAMPFASVLLLSIQVVVKTFFTSPHIFSHLLIHSLTYTHICCTYKTHIEYIWLAHNSIQPALTHIKPKTFYFIYRMLAWLGFVHFFASSLLSLTPLLVSHPFRHYSLSLAPQTRLCMWNMQFTSNPKWICPLWRILFIRSRKGVYFVVFSIQLFPNE